MDNVDSVVLSGIGYLLLLLGLVGSILPIMPGPVLIWFGALIWAWGNGFQELGWTALIVMGVLAIVAWSADLFVNTVISRRAGASWKAILGAIVGGLFGGLFLSGIVPILGTLVGAAIGAIAGMWLVEYYDKRDVVASNKAVRAYLAAMVIASAVEFTLSLTMLGIFIWQVYL